MSEVKMTLDELLKQITPLPWEAKSANDGIIAYRITGNGLFVADAYYRGTLSPDEKTGAANTNYLVHAANTLPNLVRAVQEYVDMADVTASEDTDGPGNRLLAALAKAKGSNEG